MKQKSLALLAAVFVAAAVGQGRANAAITVMGGGLARECYEAVDKRIKDNRTALSVCDLALEQEEMTSRDRAATYSNRGVIYLRLGRYDRALADFQEGLRQKETRVETQIDRGAALYGLKRYDEALAAIEEGVTAERKEARAVALYNRGLIKEHKGDVSGAYYDFQAALDADPTLEQATQQLARFRVETQQ